jgi:IS5 family transposase
MRRFAGIALGDDRIPDGPKGPWPRWGRASPKDTILNFRHLLERHGPTEAIFADVNAHLADKGITLRSGTLVDVSGRTPLVRVSPRKIIALLDEEQGQGPTPRCHRPRRATRGISAVRRISKRSGGPFARRTRTSAWMWTAA